MHHTTFRKKKNEPNMNSFRGSPPGGKPAKAAKMGVAAAADVRKALKNQTFVGSVPDCS